MTSYAQGHGGDAGGSPPHRYSASASGCQSSHSTRKRGVTKNIGLQKLVEKNGNYPLPIRFDIEDQRTFRPLGENASKFKNLVGSTVRAQVPYTYDSWSEVPEELKASIWATIEEYFDMTPHIDQPGIRTGVNMLCAERYRDAKYKFKHEWFSGRGGVENHAQIRQHPPRGMTIDDWNTQVDYYMRDKNISRSQANIDNRSRMQYPSLHGTKAYVEIRDETVV